jgi:hypothetical protein
VNVYQPKRTTVLGWASPWSGDDNDPKPWTYRIWVRAHWTDMRLRHRLGFHAWRPFPLVQDGQRCDWCGARR